MNKKRYLRMLVCLLAAVMLLSSCGTTSLKYDSSQKGYVRSSDNTVFYLAPETYLAAAVDKEEVHAELILEDQKLSLYPICGNEKNSNMDTGSWLADEKYRVYHAKGTALPLLWEMDACAIDIMTVTEKPFSMGRVAEEQDVQKVVDLYHSGESFALGALKREMNLLTYQKDYYKYQILFSSARYPGLCYVLTLYHFNRDVSIELEDGEDVKLTNVGRNVILDPTTGLCYAVEGVFDTYFNQEA